MPNDQRPAFKRIGKHDDQARHHPVVLFAVAMRQEEPALLIHQQLVQPGFQLFRGQSKLFGDRSRRIGDGRVPLVARGETSSDRVQTCFAPSCRPASPFPFRTVRPGSDATSSFAVAAFQRELDGAQALDFDAGIDDGQAAGDTELRRPCRLSDRFRQPLDGESRCASSWSSTSFAPILRHTAAEICPPA